MDEEEDEAALGPDTSGGMLRELLDLGMCSTSVPAAPIRDDDAANEDDDDEDDIDVTDGDGDMFVSRV